MLQLLPDRLLLTLCARHSVRLCKSEWRSSPIRARPQSRRDALRRLLFSLHSLVYVSPPNLNRIFLRLVSPAASRYPAYGLLHGAPSAPTSERPASAQWHAVPLERIRERPERRKARERVEASEPAVSNRRGQGADDCGHRAGACRYCEYFSCISRCCPETN